MLYGGGFKPPTKGHFYVVEETLKQISGIDSITIFIGSKTRDGITSIQSLKIWEIYSKYLSIKPQLVMSNSSPIHDIIRTIKSNPNQNFVYSVGVRESSQDDFDSSLKRTKHVREKCENAIVKFIHNIDSTSGTEARMNLYNLDKLKAYLPSQLSFSDMYDIYSILNEKI